LISTDYTQPVLVADYDELATTLHQMKTAVLHLLDEAFPPDFPLDPLDRAADNAAFRDSLSAKDRCNP
jgi:hypothetical protein